jgi:hypothetical protein
MFITCHHTNFTGQNIFHQLTVNEDILFNLCVVISHLAKTKNTRIKVASFSKLYNCTKFQDPALNGTALLPDHKFAWVPCWCC